MDKIEKLSWSEFDRSIKKIASWAEDKRVSSVYGIPRGGLVVAVALSHRLDVPFVEYDNRQLSTLVVDDICDTGQTLSKYKGQRTATIYYAANQSYEPDFWVKKKTKWVQFPWETTKTSKVDYL